MMEWIVDEIQRRTKPQIWTGVVQAVEGEFVRVEKPSGIVVKVGLSTATGTDSKDWRVPAINSTVWVATVEGLHTCIGTSEVSEVVLFEGKNEGVFVPANLIRELQKDRLIFQEIIKVLQGWSPISETPLKNALAPFLQLPQSDYGSDDLINKNIKH